MSAGTIIPFGLQDHSSRKELRISGDEYGCLWGGVQKTIGYVAEIYIPKGHMVVHNTDYSLDIRSGSITYNIRSYGTITKVTSDDKKDEEDDKDCDDND